MVLNLPRIRRPPPGSPSAAPGESPGSAGESPVTAVCDRTGAVRPLGPALGRGGEGTVHVLAGNPGVLVKLYPRETLAGPRAAQLRCKLEAMPALESMRRDPSFAWPRTLVFDRCGRWRGFAMRRVRGYSLQTLCQPGLTAERLPGWSRRETAAAARSFVRLLERAHGRGVILGDVHPGNFVVDPGSCAVSGIDCDSYQIEHGKRLFPCTVGVPLLTAPELLGADRSVLRRTVEQELFSAAVMLFRMFMLGLHPYSRVGGRDPVAGLRAGVCALGRGSGQRLPEGPWYRMWSHLPYYIKEEFITTFREGHRDPSRRTPLGRWEELLHRYAGDLDRGYLSDSLMPAAPKPDRYRGAAAGPQARTG
jgi:DNA-binding helix-hairpin-helix protein with protein kinase domain